MDQQPASRRSKLVPFLALVALGALLGSVMKQRGDLSKMREDRSRLEEQNKVLQQMVERADRTSREVTAPAGAGAAPAPPRAQPVPAPETAVPVPVKQEPALTHTPTGMAPEPRTSGLVLAGIGLVSGQAGLWRRPRPAEKR